MNTFLSKLNSVLKFFFSIDIKLIYLFSDTLPGYAFYIFCIFYGFFGCIGENCSILHSLAAIFVVIMIGLVIQTYILLKIPFTRKYLENLVGKNYLEKYLGKYTGSEAFVKLFKYVGPVAAVCAAETITANQQADRYYKAAETVEQYFDSDNKKMNRIPTDQDYQKMCEKRDAYIDKAAHSQGIITRGFSRGHAASNLPK